MRLKRIKDQNIVGFCFERAIVDDDRCFSLVQAKQFDPVVIMIFGKFIFRIQQVGNGFQNSAVKGFDGIVLTEDRSSCAVLKNVF